SLSSDLPDGLSGIFLREGVDRLLVICPSGQFGRTRRSASINCEPTGRASALPMTGSFEAIHSGACCSEDCFCPRSVSEVFKDAKVSRRHRRGTCSWQRPERQSDQESAEAHDTRAD